MPPCLLERMANLQPTNPDVQGYAVRSSTFIAHLSVAILLSYSSKIQQRCYLPLLSQLITVIFAIWLCNDRNQLRLSDLEFATLQTRSPVSIYVILLVIPRLFSQSVFKSLPDSVKPVSVFRRIFKSETLNWTLICYRAWGLLYVIFCLGVNITRQLGTTAYISFSEADDDESVALTKYGGRLNWAAWIPLAISSILIYECVLLRHPEERREIMHQLSGTRKKAFRSWPLSKRVGWGFTATWFIAIKYHPWLPFLYAAIMFLNWSVQMEIWWVEDDFQWTYGQRAAIARLPQRFVLDLIWLISGKGRKWTADSNANEPDLKLESIWNVFPPTTVASEERGLLGETTSQSTDTPDAPRSSGSCRQSRTCRKRKRRRNCGDTEPLDEEEDITHQRLSNREWVLRWRSLPASEDWDGGGDAVLRTSVPISPELNAKLQASTVDTLMFLPTELYSWIFRLATYVPEAFDTSYIHMRHEDRDAVVASIQDSMSTKIALCLASRYFHAIAEPYLYEIVMIFRFEYVPKILRCLRSISPYSAQPRGHFCRRLDFYLGAPNGPGYLDEAWYEGGHTLWGLIPTCPYLEILLARVIYQKPGSVRKGFPHLTHSVLWKTISRIYAGTLRRLELYGFSLRMDRVELMLRGDHEGRDWKRDTYDEEQTSMTRYTRGGGAIVLSSDLPRDPCLWFDDQILNEFEEAKLDNSWPPFTGHPPYMLPKLHTLHLASFDERFFEFSFPSLRSLTAKDIFSFDVLFHIHSGARYYTGPGYEICGYSPENSDDEWYTSDEPVINDSDFIYYPDPEPHCTIFGAFPPTITHLSIANVGITLANVLYFFPNLTHLTWEIDSREN
ncbi:hypothetical protein H0H92_003918, partial [Tricholoma furcatifolium]